MSYRARLSEGIAHGLRFGFMLLYAILGSNLLSSGVSAQGTRSIVAITPRAAQYLLDADATRPDRDLDWIKGTVTVRYTGSLAAQNTRVRLRLVDPDGVAIALVAGTEITAEYNPGALDIGEEEDYVFDFALRPSVRLDANLEYRFEATIDRYVAFMGGIWQIGSTYTDGPTRRYFHFTNTAAVDAEYNVVAAVTYNSLVRDWRIRGVEGRDSFPMLLMMDFARFDGWTGASVTSAVDCELRVRLYNDLGQEIAMQALPADQANFTLNLKNHNAGNPTMQNQILNLELRPAVQLDSVNRNYRFEVELKVRRQPAGVFEVHATRQTQAYGLLDFNGDLRFGSALYGCVVKIIRAARTTLPPLQSIGFLDVQLNLTEISHTGLYSSYSGAPGVIFVRLFASGLATYTGQGTFTLQSPGSQWQQVVYRSMVHEVGGTLTLSSGGATADVRISPLPSGFNFTTTPSPPAFMGEYLTGTLMMPGVGLNSQLVPLSPVTWSYPNGNWVVEESKPIAIHVNAITWEPNAAGSQASRLTLDASGEVFHVDAANADALQQAPPDLRDRTKRSNDGYYAMVAAVDTQQPVYIECQPGTIPSANARLTATFLLNGGSFLTHFPRAQVSSSSQLNYLSIRDDLIDPANSFLDMSEVWIQVNQGAPVDAACPAGGSFLAGTTFIPANAGQRLQFTPLGGLHAQVQRVLGSPYQLQWGRLAAGVYAFSTSGFTQLSFYMPGTFYPNGPLATTTFQGGHQYVPVAATLMGYVPGEWRRETTEWPGTQSYRDNSLAADYAGINMRVADEPAGMSATSYIGGVNAGSYPLKSTSRYYARISGVSGIHDAIGGPTSAQLYGFTATFDSYGMAFLDSEIVESVTNGGLVVPYPSDFQLPLNNFTFTATGRPLRADLSASLGPITLSYWNCRVLPLGMTFTMDPSDPCSLAQGFLKLYAEVDLPNLRQKLYGELGFAADGNLSTAANSDIHSRLKAPNLLTFDGPLRPDQTPEAYHFTPVTDVFFNNYAFAPEAGPGGFINVAGKLGVAFFDDLNVHLQTAPGQEGQEGIAPLHITKGWSVGSDSYFTKPAEFDSQNRGFPSGITVDAYRTGSLYRPQARRSWMSGIVFEYPLQWDTATRSFTSPEDFDNKIDLLVFEAEHKLSYLSAEQVAVDFGARFNGIPSFNLGNMLVNQIDAATGALSALQKALKNTVVGLLFAGATSFADLLSDDMDKLFGPVIEAAADPLRVALLDTLSTGDTWNSSNPQSSNLGALAPDWQQTLQHQLTGPDAFIRTQMIHFVRGNTELPVGLVDDIEAKINDVIDALDVFIGQPDPSALLSGILALDDKGNYTIAGRIVYYLMDELLPQNIKDLIKFKPDSPGQGELDKQVSKYLKQYAPQLETIRKQMTQIRARLVDVRQQITNGSIADVLEQRFNSDAGKIALRDEVEVLLYDDMVAHIRSRYGSRPDEFAVYANRIASAEFVLRRLRDRMAAMSIAGMVQTVLRQQLQDMQTAMDKAMAGVFESMNRTIREIAGQAMGAIAENFEPLSGDLAGVAGVGSITGSARVRGDTLTNLNLAANLSLELDEPIKFEGTLDINQMEAGGPYGNAREIAISAIGVPIAFLGSTANFTITGNIILDGDDSSPKAIGGSIHMVNGVLAYESFKITSLGAALMFGISDNYLAAKLGMDFEGYGLAGGIFVGRSNTIEPLAMVDKEVAALITPPFTGAYVYGELYMPVIDFGCFLRVSAGLGIGVFYFVEGPTFGGKIKATVAGRVLCIATVEGGITLIGIKSDILRFQGTGSVSGTVGWCPFCVTLKRSLTFTYNSRDGFDAKF